MDEVIPLDHPRCISGDLMVWPHPRDVILYARSSYYYDNMFIICLFLTFFLVLKPILVFKSGELAGTFAITLRFLTSLHHVFRLWFHACQFTLCNVTAKQVTNVSLVLKDSGIDSENLTSLIRLSELDGQKSDSSKVVSVIGI